MGASGQCLVGATLKFRFVNTVLLKSLLLIHSVVGLVANIELSNVVKRTMAVTLRYTATRGSLLI